MHSFHLPPPSTIKVWHLFSMTLLCILVAPMGPCSATHQLQQGALLALHCRYYKLLHLCLLWLAVAGDQIHFATDYFKSTVGTTGYCSLHSCFVTSV